jgi:hypothetical protein
VQFIWAHPCIKKHSGYILEQPRTSRKVCSLFAGRDNTLASRLTCEQFKFGCRFHDSPLNGKPENAPQNAQTAVDRAWHDFLS